LEEEPITGLEKCRIGMLSGMVGLLFVEWAESIVNSTLWVVESHVDSAYCRQQKCCHCHVNVRHKEVHIGEFRRNLGLSVKT